MLNETEARQVLVQALRDLVREAARTNNLRVLDLALHTFGDQRRADALKRLDAEWRAVRDD